MEFLSPEYSYSCLSHDVTSGSDIMPCIKIDKSLAVYILVMLCIEVHNNVACIMTKS